MISTIRSGLAEAVRLRKAVGLIYLCNLMIAAALTLPLFVLFHQKIGSLPARAEMSSGFSYSWWSAFNFRAEGLAATVRPSLSGGFGPIFDNLELLLTGNWTGFGLSLFVLGILYVLLAAFFNGGAAALIVEEKPFSMQRFFSQAGHFFHHMAALAVTLMLVFWAVYKGLYPLIFSLVDKITADSLSQPFIWAINLIGYLALIKVIFLITLIFDYARVILINEKKESSWVSIGHAALFVFRHWRAIVLNALLVAVAVPLTLTAGALFSAVGSTSVASMIIVTLLQQVFMLLLIGMRMTFYACEVVFYRSQLQAEQPIRKRKR